MAAASTSAQQTDPSPAEVVRRIGTTNDRALAYVQAPDAQLRRLKKRVKEALVPELPPVTAGALMGADGLARHFVASAAHGRYRDLFSLWDLFRAAPEACKPVLSERGIALEKARAKLTTAVRLGLLGRADRVADDVRRAEGLIWQWLRETLLADLAAVGRRPAVAVALLEREPALAVPLPDAPGPLWLAEAAEVRVHRPLPPAMEERLREGLPRLPATVATLQLAASAFPAQLDALVAAVDLDDPHIGSVLAWGRDHGYGAVLHSRIADELDELARTSHAGALARWWSWRALGVELAIPAAVRARGLEELDLARPESAALVAALVADGAAIDPQALVESQAEGNRARGEKAFEAFVCAGLDVELPPTLRANDQVRPETRCPACGAWTWVRPGHEQRCPRLADGHVTPGTAAVDTVDAWQAAAEDSAVPAVPPPSGDEATVVSGDDAPDAAATSVPPTDGTPDPDVAVAGVEEAAAAPVAPPAPTDDATEPSAAAASVAP